MTGPLPSSIGSRRSPWTVVNPAPNFDSSGYSVLARIGQGPYPEAAAGLIPSRKEVTTSSRMRLSFAVFTRAGVGLTSLEAQTVYISLLHKSRRDTTRASAQGGATGIYDRERVLELTLATTSAPTEVPEAANEQYDLDGLNEVDGISGVFVDSLTLVENAVRDEDAFVYRSEEGARAVIEFDLEAGDGYAIEVAHTSDDIGIVAFESPL